MAFAAAHTSSVEESVFCPSERVTFFLSQHSEQSVDGLILQVKTPIGSILSAFSRPFFVTNKNISFLRRKLLLDFTYLGSIL